MAKGNRLERMYPALSARERAVLAVNDWKAGRPRDARLEWTMPGEQEDEYTRLLGLSRVANDPLACLIDIYAADVGRLRVHRSLLAALRLWGSGVAELALCVTFLTTDVITEGEQARRIAEGRAERLSFAAAAQYLVERREDEIEDDDRDAELVEEKARLRAAAKAGELAVDQGRLTLGALQDWVGEESEALPAYGTVVRIVGDDNAAEAERQRTWNERALAVIRRSPVAFAQGHEPLEEAGPIEQLTLDSADAYRRGLLSTWRQVRAIELVLAGIGAELDGEAPLHPETRDLLGGLVAELRELAAEAVCGGPIALPEPTNDEVAEIRRALETVAER